MLKQRCNDKQYRNFYKNFGTLKTACNTYNNIQVEWPLKIFLLKLLHTLKSEIAACSCEFKQ